MLSAAAFVPSGRAHKSPIRDLLNAGYPGSRKEGIDVAAGINLVLSAPTRK